MVVANALREATEALAVSLQRLFEACLTAADNANRRVNPDTRALKSFRHLGIDGKLQRLFDKFGIRTRLADEFKSLSKARTCLSHRRGVIGLEDCSDVANPRLVLEFCA